MTFKGSVDGKASTTLARRCGNSWVNSAEVGLVISGRSPESEHHLVRHDLMTLPSQ